MVAINRVEYVRVLLLINVYVGVMSERQDESETGEDPKTESTKQTNEDDSLEPHEFKYRATLAKIR